MRTKGNLPVKVRGGLQWLRKRMSSPFRKAAVAAVLIVCVDLMSAACSSSQTETLSLESENSTAESTEEGAAAEAVSSVLPEPDEVSGETEEVSGGSAETAPEEPDAERSRIYVYVCGAVEHAGVYVLPEGSRVYEAVDAAGGFTLEADETAVNQALVLSDQDQLYIPTVEESSDSPSGVDGTGSDLTETGSGQNGADRVYGITSGQAAQGAGTAGETVRTDGSGSASGALVNINTADAAELQTLPGIGSTKAAAIAAYRTEHGVFRSVEDLKNVSGIGDATFEKLKSYVTVGN